MILVAQPHENVKITLSSLVPNAVFRVPCSSLLIAHSSSEINTTNTNNENPDPQLRLP